MEDGPLGVSPLATLIETATAEWPLVGRQDEVGVALRMLRSERGVVLAGPAGVGKTRLAREILALAAEAGHPVRWCVATEVASTIPLGAVAHLVPPDVTGTDSGMLVRATMHALGREESGRPTVVAVDDVHAVDPVTATLLHHLCRNTTTLLVLTHRSGHDVADAVRGLWKDGLIARLEVQPLSEPETRSLVAEVLGGGGAAEVTDVLWRRTEGNPLFLREVLLDALTAGSLFEVDGTYRWSPSYQPGPRIRELIEARIDVSPEPVRRVLELVALAEPLDMHHLERIASDAEVAEAERRHLLVIDADSGRDRAQLSHSLYGESIRAALPSARRRALLRELLTAYEESGTSRREDVLRAASWLLELDEVTARHAALMLDAARYASGGANPELGIECAAAAVAAGAGFEAVYEQVWALDMLGRHQEVVDLLADPPVAPATDGERWRVGELLAECHLALDDDASALAVGAEAERARSSATSDDERLTIDRLRLFILVRTGRLAEALELAEIVSDDPSAPLDTAIGAQAHRGWALALLGRPVEARVRCNGRLPEAMAHVDEMSAQVGQLAAALLLSELAAGDLDAAEAIGRMLYDAGAEHGDADALAWSTLFLGRIELVRGRAARAAGWLEEAVRTRQRFPDQQPWAWALLAEAAAAGGDVARATEAAARTESCRLRGSRPWDPDIDRALSWAVAAGGELSRAQDLALSAADVAKHRGYRTLEAFAAHDAVRLGSVRPGTEHLRALRDVEGPWAQVFLGHGEALTADDGHRLDGLTEQLVALGACLVAAEAAAAAARAHRSAGLLARATASAATCRRLLDSCEGASTPGVAWPEPPSPLTLRERETVLLAGTGLSNREIAERLFVSTRTVEGHLHRAYAKLGTSDRRDAARFATEFHDES